jgi:hypothetical protein
LYQRIHTSIPYLSLITYHITVLRFKTSGYEGDMLIVNNKAMFSASLALSEIRAVLYRQKSGALFSACLQSPKKLAGCLT